ncbi:MAG TPA: LysM peptidoglycan-binding domain-containing protein [Bacillota bacterium]
MVKQGLFFKWGFALLLLIFTLSLAVWGAQPDIATTTINNFDVFEADLRDVFRSLAEFGQINVLMDKQVQGTVTTRFKSGMTVKEAIEILAQTNGYSFRWLLPQRTVLIGDENSFKNIDVKQTRIYSLKYADPETVMETLKVVVPKEQIGIDKRTNQLVVKASILELQNVEEVITRLDREMPQISIELRIEEVKRSALEEAGVLWDLDNEVSLDFDKLKLNYVSGQKLKLWEENSDAKLLSKPMVATTDSKEAVIFIGDRIPIAKTTTDAAGNSSTNIEYLDVGTKLFVTPRINSENIVTVNVKANLSNVSGEATIDGNAVPIVRNRETGSVIRLRDGETFMLSGLNQIESTITEAGIKGLGKIPLLGYLFKTKTSRDPDNDTEIVIFITPRIIKTEQMPMKSSETSDEIKTSVGSSIPTVPESADVASGVSIVAETNQTPTDAETVVADSTAVAQVQTKVANSDRITVAEAVPQTQPETPINHAQAEVRVENTTQSPLPVAAPTQPQQLSTDSVPNNIRIMVKVKAGDTLTGLAVRYGITKDVILKENNLKKANLVTGQELILVIPGEHLYRLKLQETVWRISKRYGVAIEQLKEINNLTDINQVKAGQLIILPVAADNIKDNRF